MLRCCEGLSDGWAFTRSPTASPSFPNPFEGRVLRDGETILFGTLSCGLYMLRGLSKDEPQRRPEIGNLHDFEGDYCGVPTRLSTFWIQPVESESEGGLNAVIVLDRVRFPDGFGPHWSSPNREGTKIVVTGYGEHLSRRVLMMSFDPKTGALEIDESFGDGDDQGAGLMIDRETWPHGDVGPAIGHGAIFWPPAAPDWKRRPAPDGP